MIDKRITFNTGFLFLRMILVMGVTLFTSRLILKELGDTDYGIYNVVGGVVAMVSFLNTALSNGYQRFFNIALGKENKDELQKVFSSSLTIQFIVALLSIILCETIGLWFLNHEMSIPINRLKAANFVFQTSLIIFILILIRVPYHALIIAYEKMNVFAYISIVEVLLQLIAVYLLMLYDGDRLILYGILMATIGFFVMCSYVFFAKKNNGKLKSRPSLAPGYLRKLLSFSGWNIFGAIAHLLRGNGLNVLLNIFFTPAVNTANGFASQVSGGVTALAHNVLTASRPQVIKHYAKGNINEMLYLTYAVSRYIFCLLWIMCLPIMLKIDYIFEIWLGNDVPEYATLFTVLVLCTSLIEAFAAPISTLIHATGVMRNFQLCVSLTIMMVIPIAYIFLKCGYPPETVFYVSLGVGIMAQSVRVIIVKKQIEDFSYLDYWNKTISKCILLILYSISILGLLQWYWLKELPNLVDLLAVGVINTIVVLIIGLNKEEREFLIKKIKGR